MDSPTPSQDTNITAKPGLPPVQPPSGRFIVQLFVVPGAIIAVIVLLFLGSAFLVKRDREPTYFLQQLDSDNADIRWRGASDLAQILKRPEPATQRWKADAHFALELAGRLDASFKELVAEEARIGDQIAKSTDKDKHLLWRKLRTQRDHVSFLAAALGEFHVPVGAPVLCSILKHDSSPDLKGNTLQRRKALWSLMNMGANVQKFTELPAEHRDRALRVLKEEAASETALRTICARTAQFYVDRSALPESALGSVVTVDETLIATADAEDRFLRELVAMAYNFWDGERAEATLLKLSIDMGRGTQIRVEEID